MSRQRYPRATPYLILFGLAFIFFFVLQYSNVLADPDSFYHAKMAMLMRDHGIIKTFPWLGNFTVLGQAYTDQHFLYHIFLIPFVSFLQPIVGLKLATVILASAFIVTFYWLLRRFRIRFAFSFSLLPLLMGPFIFRVSLAKAPSLSLILLFLGLWMIIEGRWKLLFIFSFFYVWAYGGFSLIVIVSGLYLGIEIILNIVQKIRRHHLSWRQTVYPKTAWLTFLSTCTGVAAGLLINPYFPQNLEFYRYQLFEIGIKNYRDSIGVGGEWYPYQPFALFTGSIFLTIALIVTAVVVFFVWKRLSRRDLYLFLLTIFFLILTLKSRRYVEYYIPIACLFSFSILGASLRNFSVNRLAHAFNHLKPRLKIVAFLTLLYFFVTVPALAIRNFNNDRSDLASGFSYTKFKRSSQWLAQHSRTGDIVFHSSWDEFPLLFYYDDTNYYIGGLDPTFMYLADKELYQKWVDITIGNTTVGAYEIIKKDFRARYVFITQSHGAMKRTIADDPGFVRRYEDDEAIIYEVK
ncbi:MAG: hypothetical protein WC497_04340 [Patescibacteria group bacterium]